MSDRPDWYDYLPDFDGEDSNKGDTDLPPITLGQFQIAPGVFVTVTSLTGDLPSPRDINLQDFNTLLGIQESAAVQRVRESELDIPPDFDIAGRNVRGPFTSREEVASFLDKTGLMYVAEIYISDIFGEAPNANTSDEFLEWWIYINTGE